MEYEFIEAMYKLGLRRFPVNSQLFLRYGTMSIQASQFHYCTPRVSHLYLQDYITFEVGIICDSQKVDEILKPYHFNDSVEMKLYADVPIGLVEQVYQLLK